MNNQALMHENCLLWQKIENLSFSYVNSISLKRGKLNFISLFLFTEGTYILERTALDSNCFQFQFTTMVCFVPLI